jgi:L-iditol 2-dehydrogenase
MRVAMYYNNRDIRLEEKPVPEIGRGEILMRTEASGICGSDVLEWYRIHKAPLVLGHEVAGQVVEAGEGVDRFRKGDRIVAAHHIPCNTCAECLSGHHTCCETLRRTNFDPGGFAEYIRLPAINVDRGTFHIPDGLSYEEATFHEPLGCIIRANRWVPLQPGQCVLVFGAGIAGLLYLHFARRAGAGLIVAAEPVRSRRESAVKFGANAAYPPEEDLPERIRELNQGRLADLVFISAGAENPQSRALDCVERGGTVLYFAPTTGDVSVPVSVNRHFFRNDLTLTTSYGSAPRDSWQALRMLRHSGLEVSDMITHRLPLAETGRGFSLVSNPGASLKVIIEPQK